MSANNGRRGYVGRDVTLRPRIATKPQQPLPAPPGKPKPSFWQKYRRPFIVTSVIVAIIAGVLTLKLMQGSHAPKELTLAQKSTTLQLYYPTQLPEGFTYSQKSIRFSDAAVFYSLAYDAKKKLTASISPKPSNFDFEDFYSNVIKDKGDVPSLKGRAVVGTMGTQKVGSLVTDDEWVLLNAPSGIKTSDLTMILTSLSEIR